jgi:hypothetical protein
MGIRLACPDDKKFARQCLGYEIRHDSGIGTAYEEGVGILPAFRWIQKSSLCSRKSLALNSLTPSKRYFMGE